MGDCHSSDPGSNPGPGALVYNYPSDIEASGVRISAENNIDIQGATFASK